MVGLLTAPPGIRLYDRMKKEGRIRDEFSGLNTVASTNIVPKMDMDELTEDYQKVVHGIYHSKNYYRRVKTFLENYRPRSLHKSKLRNVLVVRIRDNGPGISEAQIPHIFDKFYQADESHSSEGNGLGLALVKRILEILQEEIRVDSRLGSGTLFTVKLPLKE